MVVVYSEFSVLLWSKALVLDLDQAEQYFIQISPGYGEKKPGIMKATAGLQGASLFFAKLLLSNLNAC